jgi:DNA-binding response OmpR family regulator
MPRETKRESSPAGARLLLLEDEAEIATLCRKVLERAGYSVTCVADGRDGIREALSRTFDACLLNVMLPGLDGYAVAAELHAARPDSSSLV